MSEIPEFPNFSLIKVPDLYNSILNGRLTRSSDFNILSLHAYNLTEDVYASTSDGCIILKMRDYLSREYFFTAAGPLTIQLVHQLIDFSGAEGLGQEIRLVPYHCAIGIERRNSSAYSITADRDNFDYIYSTSDLSALSGKLYARKREQINCANRSNNLALSPIDSTGSEHGPICIDIFDRWSQQRNKPERHTAIERHALNRLLAIDLGQTCLTLFLFDHERPIGFIIIEPTSGDTCLVHFSKTCRLDKGVGDTMLWLAARELSNRGIRWMNYEQDLGDAGLRQYKMSWRPSHFLEKVTISRFSHTATPAHSCTSGSGE